MDLPFDRTRRRRIYLMRHAEAAYITAEGGRAPDSRVVSITERGRAEAQEMADLMKEVAFDRVVVSGLQRTLETAEIVVAKRKLAVEVVSELEEIRGGDAVARARLSPPDYAYAMFRAGEPGECYAAGESFAAFADRVLPAFHKICADQNWSKVLMVCHGGVNRAILTDITCGGLRAFGSFEQDSCCLNVLDIDTCLDSGAVIRRILRGVNITAADPIKNTRGLLTLEGMAKRFLDVGAFGKN